LAVLSGGIDSVSFTDPTAGCKPVSGTFILSSKTSGSIGIDEVLCVPSSSLVVLAVLTGAISVLFVSDKGVEVEVVETDEFDRGLSIGGGETFNTSLHLPGVLIMAPFVILVQYGSPVTVS